MPNSHLHTQEASRYEKLIPATMLYSMGLMILGLVLEKDIANIPM